MAGKGRGNKRGGHQLRAHRWGKWTAEPSQHGALPGSLPSRTAQSGTCTGSLAAQMRWCSCPTCPAHKKRTRSVQRRPPTVHWNGGRTLGQPPHLVAFPAPPPHRSPDGGTAPLTRTHTHRAVQRGARAHVAVGVNILKHEVFVGRTAVGNQQQQREEEAAEQEDARCLDKSAARHPRHRDLRTAAAQPGRRHPHHHTQESGQAALAALPASGGTTGEATRRLQLWGRPAPFATSGCVCSSSRAAHRPAPRCQAESR